MYWAHTHTHAPWVHTIPTVSRTLGRLTLLDHTLRSVRLNRVRNARCPRCFCAIIVAALDRFRFDARPERNVGDIYPWTRRRFNRRRDGTREIACGTIVEHAARPRRMPRCIVRVYRRPLLKSSGPTAVFEDAAGRLHGRSRLHLGWTARSTAASPARRGR